MPKPADDPKVVAHIFWQAGCPHCSRAKEALHEIRKRTEGVQIDEVELGASAANDLLFRNMLSLLDVREPAVPFVVTGRDWIVGFGAGGRTAAAYERMIRRCRRRMRRSRRRDGCRNRRRARAGRR